MGATLRIGADAAIELGDGFLEALAPLVAAELAELSQPAEPWLGVKEAAAYLGCPTSRIYDLVRERKNNPDAGVEFRKDGSRVVFRREWLDEGLESP